MAPVALAFAVLRLTGSTGDLGVVLAARSVSVVVFLLLGGVISDRLPRHVVLVGSSVLAGLSQAAAAALLLTGSAHITALAALQVVNGATSAFAGPAASAVVPQTVPAHVLRQANALARMGSNAAAIAGAALGGVVVAVFGPGWGIAADAATSGYWEVATDGGIFSFNAPFLGSTGNIHLNKPIVGMEAAPSGQGYRFVASDGGIFTYGQAPFDGSTGNLTLGAPVVGMAADNVTNGYWLAAADGGIFSFGGASFLGRLIGLL